MPTYLASDFEGKTREQLLGIKLELDADISALKEQLAAAAAHQKQCGSYADNAWWQRANRALNIKKVQSQRVQLLIGAAGKRERQANHAAQVATDEINSATRELMRALDALPHGALPEPVWAVLERLRAARKGKG